MLVKGKISKSCGDFDLGLIMPNSYEKFSYIMLCSNFMILSQTILELSCSHGNLIIICPSECFINSNKLQSIIHSENYDIFIELPKEKIWQKALLNKMFLIKEAKDFKDFS